MRAFALASLPLFTATAFAETAPPPRVGLELGIGPAVGNIFCNPPDFCDGLTAAGGANVSVSYFYSPTFGITGDFWGLYHHKDRFTFAHYVTTFGVKWRPIPIVTFTLGGGFAIARLNIAGEIVSGPEDTDFGLAIMGAASVDVLRARHFAISIDARFGNGIYFDDGNNDGRTDTLARSLGLGAAFTVFGF